MFGMKGMEVARVLVIILGELEYWGAWSDRGICSILHHSIAPTLVQQVFMLAVQQPFGCTHTQAGTAISAPITGAVR